MWGHKVGSLTETNAGCGLFVCSAAFAPAVCRLCNAFRDVFSEAESMVQLMCCRASSADGRLAVIDQYSWQEILDVRITTVIAIVPGFCVSCLYKEQVGKNPHLPQDCPRPSEEDSPASTLFR